LLETWAATISVVKASISPAFALSVIAGSSSDHHYGVDIVTFHGQSNTLVTAKSILTWKVINGTCSC